MMQGPNVRKLVAHKVSVDAIPSRGGLADGIKFLADKQRVIDTTRKASQWVALAIQAVRAAVEPNPWKTADDEAIAAEILRQIEARKAGNPGV